MSLSILDSTRPDYQFERHVGSMFSPVMPTAGPLSRRRSSFNSEGVWSRRASILPSLSWKRPSDIEIVLDGENQFIHSYSTFDEISGRVNIKFEKDTCIDDFAITFQGQTNTYVEKVATATPTTGRTTGRHTFLRVQQPIDQRCLPEYNKALAGETYTIPFKFVVPDRILEFTCNHKVDQDSVRDSHLMLPPSIGDPMLAGQGNTLMDDLAPHMSKISYTIRAQLLKASPSIRKPELITEEKGIRIMPAREATPPLNIDLVANRGLGAYCTRKERNVRKGVFKLGKKQGCLIAESSQPSSLKLPHPSQNIDKPVTTMTTVHLRYDPVAADEQPPTLSNIMSKLRVHTFFGATPWRFIPGPDAYDVWSLTHSHYPENVELATRNLSGVEWAKHEPEPIPTGHQTQNVSISSASERRGSKPISTSTPSSFSTRTRGSQSTTTGDTIFLRRESTFSMDSSDSTATPSEGTNPSISSSQASSCLNLPKETSIPAPSELYNPSLPYYTTSIVVPVTLPMHTSTAADSPPTSRRPSAIPTSPTSPSTAGPSTAQPTPKPKSLSRKPKPVTFIPTFHSCLISRIYTLNLVLHANSAPSLNLHLPIQLSLPYTTPAPMPRALAAPEIPASWYDPFSLAEGAGEGDVVDAQNDEAIARVLAMEDAQRGVLEEVPGYDDTYGLRRHLTVRQGSLPVRNTSISVGMGVGVANSSRANDEAPPEYDSMFRTSRRSVTAPTPAPVPAAAPASDGRTNADGSQRENRSEKEEGSRRRFSLLR